MCVPCFFPHSIFSSVYMLCIVLYIHNYASVLSPRMTEEKAQRYNSYPNVGLTKTNHATNWPGCSRLRMLAAKWFILPYPVYSEATFKVCCTCISDALVQRNDKSCLFAYSLLLEWIMSCCTDSGIRPCSFSGNAMALAFILSRNSPTWSLMTCSTVTSAAKTREIHSDWYAYKYSVD